ncbi:MAG: non-hydrolyzing UDP-N-acetylglucosamine 2-epimerase [Solirubrobacteraceae bacterium]
MNVLTVVGNRPQFIKAAAVSRPLRQEHSETLVHTGQHFDDELSRVFFDELGLPSPDRELGIAKGSNTSQTARMLRALEPVVAELRPDALLVYGDTNSTLAGALAGAQVRTAVAHVEAGMRSFDRSMPEELNRVLVDHASVLLLCSSQVAVGNLDREGVSGSVELVGDVMVDIAAKVQPHARERVELVRERGLEPGEYVVATAHRAGNVDDPQRLNMLVELLLALPSRVLLPLHPRTHGRLRAAGLLERLQRSDRMVITPPLGYVEFTALVCNAAAVLTDSGGVQKEAYLAGVRCVTLRPSTEWVETVQAGWNTLVDLDREAAAAALQAPLPDERPPLYGDGQASERVVRALTLHLGAG